MSELERFRERLVGLPVSHWWQGHGSAIFLEFGDLSPGRPLGNGSVGNPKGVVSVMIEWSWRLEGPRSIITGSFDGERRWPGAFRKLIGATVKDVALFGRLPELTVAFSNGMHLASFMTAPSQPEWAILCDFGSLSARRGRLQVELG